MGSTWLLRSSAPNCPDPHLTMFAERIGRRNSPAENEHPMSRGTRTGEPFATTDATVGCHCDVRHPRRCTHDDPDLPRASRWKQTRSSAARTRLRPSKAHHRTRAAAGEGRRPNRHLLAHRAAGRTTHPRTGRWPCRALSAHRKPAELPPEAGAPRQGVSRLRGWLLRPGRPAEVRADDFRNGRRHRRHEPSRRHPTTRSIGPHAQIRRSVADQPSPTPATTSQVPVTTSAGSADAVPGMTLTGANVRTSVIPLRDRPGCADVLDASAMATRATSKRLCLPRPDGYPARRTMPSTTRTAPSTAEG